MRTYVISLIAVLGLLLWSCGMESSMEEDLQQAEMAVAQGDMVAAKSIADKLFNGENLSGISPRQLGRLSIVYMQIADRDEHTSSENVSSATECYREAYKANADSADTYYKNVAPEHTRYAEMLAHIVNNMDSPRTLPNEEMIGDSIIPGYTANPVVIGKE